jgi:hypothetical protein
MPKKGRTDWIIRDARGVVHARVNGGSWKSAQEIASAAFPEVEGVQPIGWYDATNWQRAQAKQAIALDRRQLERAGLLPPPGVPEWTDQLRARFVRAGGGR